MYVPLVDHLQRKNHSVWVKNNVDNSNPGDAALSNIQRFVHSYQYISNLLLDKGERTSGNVWLSGFSKIQLVVYYQCCFLIGWATTRIYVIAH